MLSTFCKTKIRRSAFSVITVCDLCHLSFDHLSFDHLSFDHLSFDHLSFDHLTICHLTICHLTISEVAVSNLEIRRPSTVDDIAAVIHNLVVAANDADGTKVLPDVFVCYNDNSTYHLIGGVLRDLGQAKFHQTKIDQIGGHTFLQSPRAQNLQI